MTPFETSPARRGLDELLRSAPHLDVLSVTQSDVWTLVVLGQRSEDESEAWARHNYAIFKRTGAVHGLGHDGAVTDDPVLLP